MWKWRHQKPETVQLHRRQDVLEQAIEVIDRDNLASGNVAELLSVLQKNRSRELGQKRLRQIEINVETLQPWKHFNLHLWEDLSARGLFRVRQ